jgi:predicted DCC family thiol-disulfide oxidoreductase YuxK
MLTVIFDEDCGVCSATVQWLRRSDRWVKLRFVGNLGALPPAVSPEETKETVVVLEDGGQKLVRARAVSRLLCELGAGWRLLGRLLRLPGISWMVDLGYRAFAARRHHISVALGFTACGLRRPRDQSRAASLTP